MQNDCFEANTRENKTTTTIKAAAAAATANGK